MDLNLLRTFVAIYEARSLTAAAARLFVTQPAVSQSLNRLRREVEDELFYRSKREMVPTPFAAMLYPTVRDSLSRIEGAVETSRGFAPETSSHRFRMALSELGEMRYLPHIIAAVQESGPSIGIDVTLLDTPRLPDQLTRGLVDLAVTSTALPGAFERVTLKMEPYAILMRANHPLADVLFDEAAYRAARHVAVLGDSGRPNVEAALDLIGAPIPTLTVNHFSALPLTLVSTDLVSTVPRSVAEEWLETWPLAVADLPFHVDPIAVRLYTRTTHRDAASLAWFRETTLSAISTVR
jgi:DNA-binding transcriptional LysR family regulator